MATKTKADKAKGDKSLLKTSFGIAKRIRKDKGVLIVVIHSGRHVPINESFGGFLRVLVSIRSQHQHVDAIERSSTPIFKKKFEFKHISARHPHVHLLSRKEDPEKKHVNIELIDHSASGEKSLGKATLQLDGLERGMLKYQWIKLEPSHAEVKVGLQPVDFGEVILPEDFVAAEDGALSDRKGKPAPPLARLKQSENLKTKIDIDVPGAHVDEGPGAIELIQYKPKQVKRKNPQLASGSFGAVFKGHVPHREELVIIKDLNIKSINAFEEWRREIELLGYTRYNRYVVSIYGYCFNDKKLSIVMEYMSNGSLNDFLKGTVGHNLGIIQRLRMARHCVRAMCFCHANGILHRDIKSPNILVGEDLTCKLADFGCAKLLLPHNDPRVTNAPTPRLKKPAPLIKQHTMNVGSPLWMAPEVRTREYGFPADVYSMGLVIYEILVGKLPRWNRVKKKAEVPTHFLGSEILLPTLHHDPEDRPSSHFFLELLDKWIEDILQNVYDKLKDTPFYKKQVLSRMEKGKSKNPDELDNALNDLYNYLLKFDPEGKMVNRMADTLAPLELRDLQEDVSGTTDTTSPYESLVS
mmetsp:Transcript_8005/g.8836  ORF Transcript_8005/g.8836 Transcript_8005/m.8836 type:complete len:582 (+) Transcript_8005:61-1806(+)